MIVGAVVCAVIAVVASSYLARLTLTVPDRENKRWWRSAVAPSSRRVATAVVAVIVGVLAGLAAGSSLLLVPFALLALVGTPLVIIDYEHHRLPNRLVFVLAVAAPLSALGVAAARGEWHSLSRAVEGTVAVLVVFFALAFAAPKSLGYGDVKLGGILGGYLGWFGWVDVFYGIFAGFVLGALYAIGLIITRRATRKSHVPFGPALILGTLVVLAFGLVPSST